MAKLGCGKIFKTYAALKDSGRWLNQEPSGDIHSDSATTVLHVKAEGYLFESACAAAGRKVEDEEEDGAKGSSGGASVCELSGATDSDIHRWSASGASNCD
eukprot:CAMPEP_0177274136 /NCGR_PEP_ID=MMETSP0367-20130122/67008_1 /TAXON_ID=447022 ORGANISM="Scrippsiella hangoei-like, Strain SHHI-4" /NCGR_SAMPLE_ID=MMETSP0367 /ASSEMBLY_ACC=CAM_ASM_000362 /LENGTH=100 /DNA_ID=CAMNT_0018730455 /DNA_START=668 /DNA_END=971 /DNA_ORIENTATION=+